MKKALLVIDAQKIYSLDTSNYYVENVDEALKNINHLIGVFRQKNDLIIYIKHVHALDGSDAGRMFDFAGDEVDSVEFAEGSKESEFMAGLEIVQEAPVIVKHRYDAFIGTELEETLRSNDIEKVVICGFMTNFCCDTTARHAHAIDFYVDFVFDAMGTPGSGNLSPEQVTEATLATIGDGFAVLTSAADYQS